MYNINNNVLPPIQNKCRGFSSNLYKNHGTYFDYIINAVYTPPSGLRRGRSKFNACFTCQLEVVCSI